MGKKLYVGNLSYEMTTEELKDVFTEFGEVGEVTIISDKFTGRSRGFGFVEMASDDAASKACESLNGKDLNGRKIVVNEARPARTGGGGGRNFSR